MRTDGSSGTPGAGSFTYRLLIPNDPTLVWERIYLQAQILDPESPWGVAVTSGMRISIQP